jgi:hypothetical protein
MELRSYLGSKGRWRLAFAVHCSIFNVRFMFEATLDQTSRLTVEQSLNAPSYFIVSKFLSGLCKRCSEEWAEETVDEFLEPNKGLTPPKVSETIHNFTSVAQHEITLKK